MIAYMTSLFVPVFFLLVLNDLNFSMEKLVPPGIRSKGAPGEFI